MPDIALSNACLRPCLRVTDDGLAALANRSPHLSRLTLARRQYNVFTSACTSEAGERGFCRTRPDVQLLHIS